MRRSARATCGTRWPTFRWLGACWDSSLRTPSPRACSKRSPPTRPDASQRWRLVPAALSADAGLASGRRRHHAAGALRVLVHVVRMRWQLRKGAFDAGADLLEEAVEVA